MMSKKEEKKKKVTKSNTLNKAKSNSTEKNKDIDLKRIYIGPGKLGLITNTVFDGELPMHVKQMVEECPEIEKLLVPIKDYKIKRGKVNRKGTLEYESARKVTAYIRKGRDK